MVLLQLSLAHRRSLRLLYSVRTVRPVRPFCCAVSSFRSPAFRVPSSVSHALSTRNTCVALTKQSHEHSETFGRSYPFYLYRRHQADDGTGSSDGERSLRTSAARTAPSADASAAAGPPPTAGTAAAGTRETAAACVAPDPAARGRAPAAAGTAPDTPAARAPPAAEHATVNGSVDFRETMANDPRADGADPDAPSACERVPGVFEELTKQLDTVILPTERVMRMMSEDEHVAESFCRLKAVLKPREVYDWSLLVLMTAALYPVRSEKRRLVKSGVAFTREFGFVHPGALSVRRAALSLIGPRGYVHGWGGPLPKIREEILNVSAIRYVCPADWGPGALSDGNSSYHSDSPGCEGNDSDPDFGGPRGIARARPAVTGYTSDSSDSTDGPNRLNMFPSGGPGHPVHRKLLIRFVKYIKTSNKERRERRDIRRERRLARSRYEPNRRLAEPLYDMEARRAEALAAERKRNAIGYERCKVARAKEFRRVHRAVHDEVVDEEADDVATDSTQTQTRLNKFLMKVRSKVIRRWTEQADRRIIDLQHELENNDEEMHFLSWMSPIHWIKQTGPNCGLAVLAMAARPVMVCEVALNLVDKTMSSTINLDPDSKQLKVTKLRALKSDEYHAKTCCEITNPPLIILPPELRELQCEAVMNNYSSRGEMFSALAMGKLAYSHHVGQYSVHLVNRDLWNEYENEQLNKKQNDMEANNVAHEKNVDDNLSVDYDDINDMCEQEMDVDDVSLNSEINDNISTIDLEMSDNNENSISPSLLQQDKQFVKNSALPSLLQEDDEFEGDFNFLDDDGQPEDCKFECLPKEKIDITDDCGLTVSPNSPMWRMSVVKHLMSGNRIAVCYDCDKNMKPSLNNNGSSAHWAIMCGVIVGKVFQKKKYDNKENGFLYMCDKDTHELRPVESFARNNINEGTANVDYLFDGGNVDVGADCVNNGEMERDEYCGDNQSYNDIMHNVDLNNVWIVIQHGKNMGDIDVLHLDQIVKSNRQLRLPNKNILSCFWSWNDDEDTTDQLLQSLSLASLFGSTYKSSHANVNSPAEVLENHDDDADQNPNEELEQNAAGPSPIPPPPPPPPPTPPPSPVMRSNIPRPYLPFVLPEGVRLDNCLAQRFIVFKPIRSSYFVSNIKDAKFNLCPEQRKGAPQALDPLMCFFTFDAATLA